MGRSKDVFDNDHLATEVARAQEVLRQAGLVATNVDLTPDGRLVIPKGALKFADAALAGVASADPSNTQEVAASQLRISELFYQSVLSQARQSFRAALAAAGIGLMFFVAAVCIVLTQDKLNAAVISAVSGGIIEVIASLNFWLYAKTSRQLDTFHVRLDRMQRFLVANSVTLNMTGTARDQSVAELVRIIADSATEAHHSSSLP